MLFSPKKYVGRDLVLRTAQNPNANYLRGCYLEDELTVPINANYNQPFQFGSDAVTNISSVINMFSGGSGVPLTGQNKFFSYKIWSSTDPISVKVPVTFFMGQLGEYSAKVEVHERVRLLQNLVLPAEANSSTGQLGSPTLTMADALVDFGEHVQDTQAAQTMYGLADRALTMFSDENQSTVSSEQQFKEWLRTQKTSGSDRLILQVGKILYLEQVVVESVNTTYSSQVDEDGYPISAKVELDISSSYVVTRKAMSQKDEE